MGSAATMTEIGLALQPAMTGFLGGISAIGGDGDSKVVNMEEYVQCLEEERRKIEAFKRELPLCMLILTNVISSLKEEAMQRKRKNANACPVLEQLMPLKNKAEDEIDGVKKLEKDVGGDKMNWMSSAQLWSNNSSDCNSNGNNTTGAVRLADERTVEADRQSESGNPFGKGGAFVPFKGPAGDHLPATLVPDLSLLSPGSKITRSIARAPDDHPQSAKTKVLVSPFISVQSKNSNMNSQQQGPRKVRRCWSPELHRRFVGALQQLGGPQAATPKQIRELMKVDGLTNDEVKSHLQKYRLHTRRPTPSTGSVNQSAAIFGELWVPSNDHYKTSNLSNSQSASGSPQGPLQFSAAVHGISLTGVDSCEEDDRKSESFSWKGSSQRLEEEAE